jgi:hypothetical protein
MFFGISQNFNDKSIATVTPSYQYFFRNLRAKFVVKTVRKSRETLHVPMRLAPEMHLSIRDF